MKSMASAYNPDAEEQIWNLHKDLSQELRTGARKIVISPKALRFNGFKVIYEGKKDLTDPLKVLSTKEKETNDFAKTVVNALVFTRRENIRLAPLIETEGEFIGTGLKLVQ